MNGVVGTNLVAQIGFIVADIEKTKKKWAEFLGVDVPENVDIGPYEITQTEYKGKKVPDSKCVMAFFDVGPNLQIELIQPNEEPSTWREFLDEHGEGVHHLGFNVKGMKQAVDACLEFGMKLEQKAEYGDQTGRYTYLSAYDDLKVLIELLESDVN